VVDSTSIQEWQQNATFSAKISGFFLTKKSVDKVDNPHHAMYAVPISNKSLRRHPMTTTESTSVTFAVQHPSMSHALLMDGYSHHSTRFVKNWAVRYLLENHDVLLPVDGFLVQIVDADTDADYSMF